MKEIIRAPHSGFCFGVEQAISKAMNVESEKEINTCGPLIHNKRVTETLKEKGIGLVDNIEMAKNNSVLIVRSHGEPKSFYDKAKEKNIELVDATCPYVSKIHQLSRISYEEGKQVIIIGDKVHPEVIGINGWTDNSAIVINNKDQVKKNIASLKEKKCFVVSQTTMIKEKFDEVLEELKKYDIDLEIRNTICNATKERQDACIETAKIVDVMLVIGDKKSSNTRKLYEIAKKYCKKAYFIENKRNLPLKEMEKYNKIGVAAGASTPDNAIKEVIANMSDKTQENELTMLDFMEEIDKSLRLPRSGELVMGKVHQVSEKEIIVNLGCKKDGVIPLDEISLEGDQKLTDLFKEGDDIQAKVLKTDDGDGTILLSKKKLEASEHWEEINKAYEDKTLIEVQVVRQVNGGVIATYKEVSGFIPLSQLSDRFVEDSSEFIGKVLTVRISRVDARRGKAVFSHKAYLNEERQKALEEIWKTINVDDIVEGKVMRFTDYGAFVDIGGIDGLLHISEISWGKLKHPQEVLKIGETITVRILSMNSEKGKISLGLKQTQPEPWSIIDDKYKVGDVVTGKVLQIKEYGCFVELEPGLDGLVHISEVDNKRVANINDELNVGQQVNAKILEIDKDRKRISLSIKETLDKSTEEEIAPVEDEVAEVAPAEEEATEVATVEDTVETSEEAATESSVEEEVSEEESKDE